MVTFWKSVAVLATEQPARRALRVPLRGVWPVAIALQPAPVVGACSVHAELAAVSKPGLTRLLVVASTVKMNGAEVPTWPAASVATATNEWPPGTLSTLVGSGAT